MTVRKPALNTLIVSALIFLAAVVLAFTGLGMKFQSGADIMVNLPQLWWGMLAIVIFSFVFGWIRYDLASAFTLFIAALHDQLLTFALSSLVGIFVGLSATLPAFVLVSALFTYCFTIPFIRESRLIARGASLRELSREGAAKQAQKAVKPLALWLLGAILLVFIAMVVSGNALLLGNLVPLFAGLAAALLSSTLITPSIWAAFAARRKNRK
jgi:preprotein translocase subunit SecF